MIQPISILNSLILTVTFSISDCQSSHPNKKYSTKSVLTAYTVFLGLVAIQINIVLAEDESCLPSEIQQSKAIMRSEERRVGKECRL